MDSVSDLLALGKAQNPFYGFTLAGCQMSTKAALSPPPQLERKYNKKLLAEIMTGRNHSLITVVGKTDTTWGDELNLLPIKIRSGW